MSYFLLVQRYKKDRKEVEERHSKQLLEFESEAQMERDRLLGENRELQVALETQRSEFEFEVDELKRDFDLEKGRLLLETQTLAQGDCLQHRLCYVIAWRHVVALFILVLASRTEEELQNERRKIEEEIVSDFQANMEVNYSYTFHCV